MYRYCNSVKKDYTIQDKALGQLTFCTGEKRNQIALSHHSNTELLVDYRFNNKKKNFNHLLKILENIYMILW